MAAQSLRSRVRRAFEDPTYPNFHALNFLGVCVSIIAVVVVVLETEPWMAAAMPWLADVERVLAALFAAEYVLRLWSSERPLAYLKSAYGIVDLVSFLPSFLSFGNLTFLKTARAFRIVRFLRLARLAKVARIEQSAHQRIGDDDRRVVEQNVRIYLATLFASVVLVGTLAYLVEPETFTGALSGSVWAISEILGGGLVEQVVVTPGGKAVAIAARFAGFVLLGFLVNVVAGVINQVLLGRRSAR